MGTFLAAMAIMASSGLIWTTYYTLFTPSNQQIFRRAQRRQDTCFVRTCNQLISGRNLRYGRVLEIVQNEEYLDAADLDQIRRRALSSIPNYQFQHRTRVKRQTAPTPKPLGSNPPGLDSAGITSQTSQAQPKATMSMPAVFAAGSLAAVVVTRFKRQANNTLLPFFDGKL